LLPRAARLACAGPVNYLVVETDKQEPRAQRIAAEAAARDWEIS
jgi:hypothetical protein